MALPALEKTWEFRTNIGAADIGDLQAHKRASYMIKNLLTDTIANGYQDGTIANVAGDTYSISGITDDVVDVSMVTKTVKIRGSSNPLNDGDFPIVSVPSSSEFHYTNANGVPEAVAGSWNIIGGNFTSPWVMQHCQVAGGVVGTEDDEVDRIGRASDGDVTSSNFHYWVVKNPVTGTQWCWAGQSNTTGGNDHYGTTRATTYPNTLLPGPGGSGSLPTGTVVVNVAGSKSAHRTFNNASPWYWGTTGATAFKLHLAMSSDGQNTRLIGSANGYIQLFWFDETVKNPHPDWISGGNATVTQMWGTGGNSNRATYGTYNDAANIIGSRIPATGVSNMFNADVPDLYMTAEGYGSATVGENISVANELTGDYALFPMGLVCTELGHRARLGQIVDMWWCPTSLTAGNTMPDNTSRQFLVLEDIVIPWDGSLPELS